MGAGIQVETPLLLLLIILVCVLLDVLEASVHIEFSSVSGRWWWRFKFKGNDDISDGTVVLRSKGIDPEKFWFIAVTKRIFTVVDN